MERFCKGHLSLRRGIIANTYRKEVGRVKGTSLGKYAVAKRRRKRVRQTASLPQQQLRSMRVEFRVKGLERRGIEVTGLAARVKRDLGEGGPEKGIRHSKKDEMKRGEGEGGEVRGGIHGGGSPRQRSLSGRGNYGIIVSEGKRYDQTGAGRIKLSKM